MGATVRRTALQARSGGVRAAVAAACIFVAASSAPGLAVAQAPIEPVAPPWSFAPALDNKKEAENISGAVCAPPGAAADPARRCLLVSDEVSGDSVQRAFRMPFGAIRRGQGLRGGHGAAFSGPAAPRRGSWSLVPGKPAPR